MIGLRKEVKIVDIVFIIACLWLVLVKEISYESYFLALLVIGQVRTNRLLSGD